jgi:hypothetical protein
VLILRRVIVNGRPSQALHRPILRLLLATPALPECVLAQLWFPLQILGNAALHERKCAVFMYSYALLGYGVRAVARRFLRCFCRLIVACRSRVANVSASRRVHFRASHPKQRSRASHRAGVFLESWTGGLFAEKMIVN